MYHIFKLKQIKSIWNFSFMVSHTVYFKDMMVFTLTVQMYHRISVLMPVLVRVPEYSSTSTSTEYEYYDFGTHEYEYSTSTRKAVLKYEYWVWVPQPCYLMTPSDWLMSRQAWPPRARYGQWARCKHWRPAVYFLKKMTLFQQHVSSLRMAGLVLR